ncbi:MAG TPA: DNA-binding domain-containing protein [Pseudomonadales bacterium]|nr:DNA-binding domain-containing protein [Pseudomonadales bacterium]
MSAPTLLELQRDFAGWILGNETGIEAHIKPRGLQPRARLTIYRNMVTNNLCEALETVYPMTRALVGESFFDMLAARYVQKVPSTSGKLQDYGRDFSDFIETVPETDSVAYLGEVARLEWLRQKSALAPIMVGMAPAGLAQQDSGQWPDLGLHPSLQLLASRYPVLDIYRYCQNPTGPQPNVDAPGQQVALWRNGAGIEMRTIDVGWYRFIEQLTCGASRDLAGKNLDPAAPLAWLLGQGLIVAL